MGWRSEVGQGMKVAVDTNVLVRYLVADDADIVWKTLVWAGGFAALWWAGSARMPVWLQPDRYSPTPGFLRGSAGLHDTLQI